MHGLMHDLLFPFGGVSKYMKHQNQRALEPFQVASQKLHLGLQERPLESSKRTLCGALSGSFLQRSIDFTENLGALVHDLIGGLDGIITGNTFLLIVFQVFA